MYKPGDAYYGEFTTQGSTGAATNADSLPVATANHNGADDGTFALTVTNLDAGRYKVTGTVPASYLSGDVVNISVAATVSSIAGKARIDSFNVDTKRGSDLAFMLRAFLTITGATTGPVTADQYSTGGFWSNAGFWTPYYTSTALSAPVFAWTDGTFWYLTTTAPGIVKPAGYFKTAASATVTGPYTAQGTATGTPAVVAHGNSILSNFQPDITIPTAAQNGSAAAADILANPAHLLVTDAFGEVGVNNIPTIPTPPTAIQIRQEMDNNSTRLQSIVATLAATAQGGTVSDTGAASGSFKGNAGLSAVDGYYVGMFLAFQEGATLFPQAREVMGYVGATRSFSFTTPFVGSPANADPFIVVGHVAG